MTCLADRHGCPHIIAAIPFGSCYGYSPGGVCAVSRRSRVLCARLKAGDAGFLAKYALQVRQECSAGQSLAALFAKETTLIPVPSSAPSAAGSITVAERLAEALLRQGLGAAVWPGLKRTSPVRKSATAQAGARPTVEDHYRSFGIAGLALPSDRILLVDDVVTKGRTLLAAAARLQHAFPQVRIQAFALLRTMSLRSEIVCLVQPCIGEIRWRRGDARRSP